MSPSDQPGVPEESGLADTSGVAISGKVGSRTRSRLMEAGAVVLADRGYHAARVDDVVELAGVSHGTFYSYFRNKDALVLALAEQCADELGRLTASLGDVPDTPSGRTFVREWLLEFVEMYESYGTVIRSWIENQSENPELAELGIQSLAQVSETLVNRVGQSHPEDADLRVAALISVIERFTYLLVNRGMQDRPDVIETAATVLHRSFFAAA